MIVTDAQVHLWKEDSPERPWPPGGRERAHRPGSMTADEVLRLMDEVGVDRAVLVPPSFEGDRNDVCLQAARSHPDRFTVMGRIRPDPPMSPADLARWMEARPGMRGVRLTLSRGAAQKWLEERTLDWLWSAAEEIGMPVYILPPGLMRQVRSVAQRHPRLRLVIDHLGLRTGLRDEAILPGIDEVLKLSDLPNVAVKATSLPSYVSERYPFPTLQEIIRRVVAAFGTRRVFWGSDLSRLPCSYREVLTLFTEELDFLSSDDLEWIMGRGVNEWLAWPP